MSKFETAKLPTFRLAFAVGSLAGVNAELCNPAGSGKRMTLRRHFIRVDTNVQCFLKRNTNPCTGGTSTSYTPVSLASDQPQSAATAKVFSAAPTEGANPTSFGRVDLFGGAFYDSGHLKTSEQEQITILPGEYLTLFTNASGVTLTGYVDWTEATI